MRHHCADADAGNDKIHRVGSEMFRGRVGLERHGPKKLVDVIFAHSDVIYVGNGAYSDLKGCLRIYLKVPWVYLSRFIFTVIYACR